jgi:hypothetical protein
MKRIAPLAFGIALLLTQPLAAKPKHKEKGVPPGQLRKAEVHESLARGESPSRRYSPPERVYRSWNRDRIYDWENRRYHWDDGAWVIIVD